MPAYRLVDIIDGLFFGKGDIMVYTGIRICKHFPARFAVVCLVVTVSLADTVYLKNGGKVEGIIIEETDEQVVVDLGFGKTTVQREKIDRIERSSESENRSRESQWEADFIFQDRYIPERCKDLAASFKKLAQLHTDATRRNRELTQLKANIRRLQNQIKRLTRERQSISREMESISPWQDAEEYNRLVGELNRVLIAGRRAQQREAELFQEIGKGNRSFPLFVTAIDEFETKTQALQQKLESSDMSEKEETFFALLAKRLEVIKKDIQTTVVAIPREEGVNWVVLDVRINKAVTARMLVDTGASILTLSRDVADKLRLDLSDAPTVQAKLADGNTVPAKAALLDEVQVHDAVEQNVRALILDSPPTDGIDGLLGMSFLGRYVINLDTSAGKLELKKIAD